VTESAAYFRSLHTPGSPLVLVNAWDAASARVAEEAGSRAVATTSAGIAWSLGVRDGDVLDRAAAVAATGRVVAAVKVPVTADIESGFGADPGAVAETIRLIAGTGAVGVNIEDGVRGIEEQAARLAAAKGAAGDGLFINARIDEFLRGGHDIGAVLARAQAFLDAGADGVFVPGVADPATIEELVAKIAAPLNVLVGPGSPTVPELARLGVARVSLGSGVASAAYAVMRKAAREALTTGTYASLAEEISYSELNSLL
jgi:2-methylisocitrate lyase-like PEP mutase family enzyme